MSYYPPAYPYAASSTVYYTYAPAAPATPSFSRSHSRSSSKSSMNSTCSDFSNGLLRSGRLPLPLELPEDNHVYSQCDVPTPRAVRFADQQPPRGLALAVDAQDQPWYFPSVNYKSTSKRRRSAAPTRDEDLFNTYVQQPLRY